MPERIGSRQTLLVIGAHGYLGSVAGRHLAAAGHHAIALGRSAPVPDEYDGVLYFAPPSGDAVADRSALSALLAPLRGTGRLFLYVSGTWVLGATGPDPVDETAPVNPIELVSYRPQLEQQVLATVDSGVRGVVLRPGLVHGHGAGIPAMLVDWARAAGTGRFVGTPAVRWPMVHVDDLGELVVAAVDRAAPGLIVHGVAEPAVRVVDLAGAAAAAVGCAGAQAWPVEQARQALGRAFADALALDQAVSGDRARVELGWRPRRIGAVADLAIGSYRDRAAA
ncbi:MAG TPA: hypothetical protein VF163_00405 [Micromonosporaceae bacterium]